MPKTYMVPDMPADDYHSGPECSSNFLKRMLQSPFHAHYARTHPAEPGAALRFGTAWHSSFFEPEKFAAEFATGHDAHPATNRAKVLADVLGGVINLDHLVALPEGLSTKTKEGRALVADLESEGKIPLDGADFAFVHEWQPRLAGRVVIAEEDLDKITTMNASAHAHPITRVLLDPKLGGMAEPSIFTTDEETGVRLRVRPDWLVPPCAMFPNGLIVDGKTTGDASPAGFARQAWNLGYYLQAGLYPMVVQKLFKSKGLPDFLWLAIEKDAPHCSAYYAATWTTQEADGSEYPGIMQHGFNEVRRLLPIYAECERTGVWPGYSQEVAPIQMPSWARKAMGGGDEVEIVGFVGGAA